MAGFSDWLITMMSRRHSFKYTGVYPCVDAASGANVPEGKAFDRVIGSLIFYPVVVRLIQGGLFQLNVLALFQFLTLKLWGGINYHAFKKMI